MKFFQRLFALLVFFVVFTTTINFCCTIPKQYKPNKNDVNSIDRLRDSILQVGLDGEALYTILGNIKPMSSVVSFNFPLGNSDSTKKLDGNILQAEEQIRYLDRLSQIQQALNAIDIPDLKFVMVPYRSTYSSSRVLQVTAVRISSVDSVLDVKKSFFGQYGFVRGTDPAVLLTVNEYEKRYERLRGYGYLFGYPDYAIDFFVRAFQQSDSTGKHVERNFFQIPTFKHASGSFVYAYPKDQHPTEVDSTLYRRSQQVLKSYKIARTKYINADSSIRAYDLIKDYNKKVNFIKAND